VTGQELVLREETLPALEDTDDPRAIDELLDEPPGFNLVASLHPTGDPRARHS